MNAVVPILLFAALTGPPPAEKKAQDMMREAVMFQARGDFPGSLRQYRKAIHQYEIAYGKHGKQLTSVLTGYAAGLGVVGDYLAARGVYERVLAIETKHFGNTSMQYARALQQVAVTYWQRGDFKRAERDFRLVLDLYIKNLGPDSDRVATQLDVMAAWYKVRNDWPRAQALHERALVIREKKGKDHPSVMTTLFQLAWLHSLRGQHHRATEIMERVLRISEAAKHPITTRAAFLGQLAQFYQKADQPQKAAPLNARVEQLWLDELKRVEQNPNQSHWDITLPLISLSSFYSQSNQTPKAIPYIERLLAHMTQKHGAKHPAVGGYKTQLALALRKTGNFKRARALLRQAVQTEKAWLGKRATGTKQVLADFEHQAGNLRVAQKLYAEVQKQTQQIYGQRHPYVANTMERQAILAWGQGRIPQALELFASAMDIQEKEIGLILSTGTEADKRKYLDSIAFHQHEAVSFHLQGAPTLAAAADLALTVVLQRKGRVLDAVADSFGSLHRRLKGKTRQILEQLASERAQLAKLVLNPPQTGKGDKGASWAKQVGQLETRVRNLEAKVSRESVAYRAQSAPITLGGVRAALPSAAVLVEFTVYRPVQPGQHGTANPPKLPRYAAAIAGKTGPAKWVDLGETEPIDLLAFRLREALADPDRSDVKALARALDELVMRPIRAHLGTAKHLFVAPDGALNLVPLATLVDENDRWLIETYEFTYLSSGRDLLRLLVRAPAKSAPHVVANPTFGGGAPVQIATGPSRGLRSYDLRNTSWAPLPGTADEAKVLGQLLEGATVLTGDKATEQALKKLTGPRILHVATHGFFLADQGTPGLAGPENPLLRSGLILSGANGLDSGDEDGVLTALEASGLDLWGTQLVVLSACETGLGKAVNGQGVYGLRRALVIAGSESQVMSLWQVDDDATRDLMVSFYKRLSSGKGRSQALRAAQLRLLADQERSHPFFWGGFIGSGHWGPMP